MRRVAAARTLCACALVLALVLSSSAASVLAHEQRVLHAPHVAHASDADDCEATAPVVQTVQGPVLGKCYTVATPPSTSSPSSSTSTSVCVCSFRGVPFAASTGGANRFRPPQPRAAWSPAVWNATVYGPGCPQTHHNPDVPPVQSEDCLNLNVWLPRSALGNGTLELEHKQQQGAQQQQQQQQQQLLPVSLFMHGGSFEEGGGNIPFYECGYVAGNGRAGAGSICITINYRLGPLGWLVTDTVGGNMGLMDQRAALQWVQANIRNFGGDPGRVTLWGESAGAMSVGVHMVSPKSAGLFHRAVMESNPLSIVMKDFEHAKAFGAYFCADVNCPTCDLECMQAAPLELVQQAGNKAGGSIFGFLIANHDHPLDGFLTWTPTVTYDDEFPLGVFESFVAGHVNHVPLLVGSNLGEGETFILAGINFPLNDFEYTAAIMAIFGKHAQDVLKYYPGPIGPHTDGRLAFSHMLTDMWFRCPARVMARSVGKFGAAANVSGYVYEYDHVLSFNPWGKWLPMCVEYVCHASELPVVFHFTANWTFTPPEAAMSDGVVQAWTHFADVGTPATVPEPAGWPVWRPHDGGAETSFVLHLDVPVWFEDSFDERCTMWDKIGYVW